jgi:outer membrane protein TolC
MSRRNKFRLVEFTIVLGWCGLAQSAAAGDSVRVIRSGDVIDVTMKHNPSLQAAVIQEQIAAEAIRAAEGLYPFIFSADTGYTHMSTPMGSSLYRVQDSYALGGNITKTFSVGTAVDLRLEGQWYQIDNPATGSSNAPTGTGSTSAANDSPNFGIDARLSLTQPLLRGFGNRVGLADLRQAEKEKTAAEKSTDAAASNAARDVLLAYWDLWLALKTVEINERSRDVARQQLEETKQRVASGDAAPVDELSYQTRLASLMEAVIVSKAEVKSRQVALAEKTGAIEDNTLLSADIGESLPDMREVMPLNDIVRESLKESPSIQEAFTQVQIAEERLKVAGESMRQRLDLIGWIEAATLAENDATAMVADFGNGGAYSGYIGLAYELPLDDRKKQGERAQARLAVQVATRQLQGAKNAVQSDAARTFQALAAAKERLAMAEETLRLAQAQAEAERERYRLGASIFTAVRDAEETVRGAELRVVGARIDIVQSEIEIDNLTGVLLKRLAKRD